MKTSLLTVGAVVTDVQRVDKDPIKYIAISNVRISLQNPLRETNMLWGAQTSHFFFSLAISTPVSLQMNVFTNLHS